uniref:Uncharacterized protein n=1 Tax=Sphenodon punctatus TaxID=8508 RepID=A0A8D0GB58_SPHPU
MVSWLGKINLFKMIVLPKLLYRLMAIPIQLPVSFFKMCDELLRDIVWNGKKPRFRKQVLVQLKEKGGLNVPDIKLYHTAASLAGLYDWYHEAKAPEWAYLEKELMGVKTLKDLIVDKGKVPREINLYHPFIGNLLKTWGKTKKKLGLVGDLSPFTPIDSIQIRESNLAPGIRMALKKRGVSTMEQLFLGGKFVSHQRLKSVLKEEISEFQYLQLKAMVSSPLNRESLKREPHKIEKILFKINKASGRLGRLYRELKNALYTPSVDYIMKWGRDLNTSIDQGEEKKIWSHMNKCVFSLEVREIQVKLTTRYYLTPERLKFADPEGGGLCWRGCGEVGTYMHCWWYCGRVQLFWSKVWKIVNKVAAMVVPFRPETALLGLYPNTKCMISCQNSCKIICLAAINIIARHWRSLEDLTMNELLHRIWYMHTMEDFHADLHNKKQDFETIWAPIRKALDNLNGTT